MYRSLRACCGLLWVAAWMICGLEAAPAQQQTEVSPAASPVPPTEVPQEFSPELVAEGRTRFAAHCGFCHGPEATGGSGGADLTRSELVASDRGGDRIEPLVRAGLPELGMPAFPGLSADDLSAIVAFVHDQKTQAESAVGGRRSVLVEDLQTGDADAGQRYFSDACTGCHGAATDLAGIATRFQGLALLRRMLYPGRQPGVPEPRRPTAVVTTAEGGRVAGEVAYRDEFTIAVIDRDGRYRSWPVERVTANIDDPLEAHVQLLPSYTDQTMHDVLAYLQTLR